MLTWNARAETATNIILWLGSLVAVLIIIIWLGKNITPANYEYKVISEDLEKLQYDISDACNSFLLNRTYNPKVEAGNFTVNDTFICIRTKTFSQCKQIICNISFNAVYDLSNITYITILKQNQTIYLGTIK
jgi:hypothetical protein